MDPKAGEIGPNSVHVLIVVAVESHKVKELSCAIRVDLGFLDDIVKSLAKGFRLPHRRRPPLWLPWIDKGVGFREEQSGFASLAGQVVRFKEAHRDCCGFKRLFLLLGCQRFDGLPLCLAGSDSVPGMFPYFPGQPLGGTAITHSCSEFVDQGPEQSEPDAGVDVVSWKVDEPGSQCLPRPVIHLSDCWWGLLRFRNAR